MKCLLYSMVLFLMSVCLRAEERISTNWPVAIQEFRESSYSFRYATDMSESKDIKWVYVPIDVPKGRRLPLPDYVIRIFKKDFRSNEYLGEGEYRGETEIAGGPALMAEWAMFDEQGNSQFLLMLYVGNRFSVSGLYCVEPERIYQSCSNEYWRGSFISAELSRLLLPEGNPLVKVKTIDTGIQTPTNKEPVRVNPSQ